MDNSLELGFCRSRTTSSGAAAITLQAPQHPNAWKEYSLPVLIAATLLVGGVLEFSNSKLAPFVNVGFFLLAAAYAVDVLFHATGDPEARIFGWLLGIPAAFILIVDVFLYSMKKRAKRA